MSIKTIEKQLRTAYPKGRIRVWYCPQRNCDFASQDYNDAAWHEISSIGHTKHETKLYIRN
jgi:hypothetical protein